MSTDRKRAKAQTPERYLWQKPGARYLWFRLAVPTRYRDVEPRKIIQRSVGTADRREASVQAARIRAELDAHWKGLLAPAAGADASCALAPRLTPSQADLEAAAAEAGYLKIRPQLAAIWADKRGFNGSGYQPFIDSVRQTRERYIRTWDTETIRKWETMADKAIAAYNWNLPKGSDTYRALVQMMAEAAIEALRVELETRQGNFGAEPTSKVVVAGLRAHADRAPPGETILVLFERYAAQRLAEKRKRPDTVNQDRKIMEGFAAFVGADRKLDSIKGVEVREWRDAVAAAPANYAKAKGFAGLSLREVAAKAQQEGATGLSPTTVNKYLSTVSPLFDWCRRNGYASNNPCDGLFYDLPKGRNPRPPFSNEQLQAIFSSPLFTGFLRDGKEHLPGERRADDWRYWIPLVCLFTGARIGEIAQLRVEDVREEEGIPYLLIRDNEATGQRTKSGHSRPAPIHSNLQRIGFLRFVERQQERARGDGNPQLFPHLEPNERDQISGTPSRFLRDYLRRIRIKSGGDGVGAHSFRHTMADRLRAAGYFDDEIAIVLGHSHKTVTSGYGQVRQGTVARLSAMIEQVSFPVDLWASPGFENDFKVAPTAPFRRR